MENKIETIEVQDEPENIVVANNGGQAQPQASEATIRNNNQAVLLRTAAGDGSVAVNMAQDTRGMFVGMITGPATVFFNMQPCVGNVMPSNACTADASSTMLNCSAADAMSCADTSSVLLPNAVPGNQMMLGNVAAAVNPMLVGNFANANYVMLGNVASVNPIAYPTAAANPMAIMANPITYLPPGATVPLVNAAHNLDTTMEDGNNMANPPMPNAAVNINLIRNAAEQAIAANVAAANVAEVGNTMMVDRTKNSQTVPADSSPGSNTTATTAANATSFHQQMPASRENTHQKVVTKLQLVAALQAAGRTCETNAAETSSPLANDSGTIKNEEEEDMDNIPSTSKQHKQQPSSIHYPILKTEIEPPETTALNRRKFRQSCINDLDLIANRSLGFQSNAKNESLSASQSNKNIPHVKLEANSMLSTNDTKEMTANCADMDDTREQISATNNNGRSNFKVSIDLDRINLGSVLNSQRAILTAAAVDLNVAAAAIQSAEPSLARTTPAATIAPVATQTVREVLTPIFQRPPATVQRCKSLPQLSCQRGESDEENVEPFNLAAAPGQHNLFQPIASPFQQDSTDSSVASRPALSQQKRRKERTGHANSAANHTNEGADDGGYGLKKMRRVNFKSRRGQPMLDGDSPHRTCGQRNLQNNTDTDSEIDVLGTMYTNPTAPETSVDAGRDASNNMQITNGDDRTHNEQHLLRRHHHHHNPCRSVNPDRMRPNGSSTPISEVTTAEQMVETERQGSGAGEHARDRSSENIAEQMENRLIDQLRNGYLNRNNTDIPVNIFEGAASSNSNPTGAIDAQNVNDATQRPDLTNSELLNFERSRLRSAAISSVHVTERVNLGYAQQTFVFQVPIRAVQDQEQQTGGSRTIERHIVVGNPVLISEEIEPNPNFNEFDFPSPAQRNIFISAVPNFGLSSDPAAAPETSANVTSHNDGDETMNSLDHNRRLIQAMNEFSINNSSTDSSISYIPPLEGTQSMLTVDDDSDRTSTYNEEEDENLNMFFEQRRREQRIDDDQIMNDAAANELLGNLLQNSSATLAVDPRSAAETEETSTCARVRPFHPNHFNHRTPQTASPASPSSNTTAFMVSRTNPILHPEYIYIRGNSPTYTRAEFNVILALLAREGRYIDHNRGDRRPILSNAIQAIPSVDCPDFIRVQVNAEEYTTDEFDLVVALVACRDRRIARRRRALARRARTIEHMINASAGESDAAAAQSPANRNRSAAVVQPDNAGTSNAKGNGIDESLSRPPNSLPTAQHGGNFNPFRGNANEGESSLHAAASQRNSAELVPPNNTDTTNSNGNGVLTPPQLSSTAQGDGNLTTMDGSFASNQEIPKDEPICENCRNSSTIAIDATGRNLCRSMANLTSTVNRTADARESSAAQDHATMNIDMPESASANQPSTSSADMDDNGCRRGQQIFRLMDVLKNTLTALERLHTEPAMPSENAEATSVGHSGTTEQASTSRSDTTVGTTGTVGQGNANNGTAYSAHVDRPGHIGRATNTPVLTRRPGNWRGVTRGRYSNDHLLILADRRLGLGESDIDRIVREQEHLRHLCEQLQISSNGQPAPNMPRVLILRPDNENKPRVAQGAAMPGLNVSQVAQIMKAVTGQRASGLSNNTLATMSNNTAAHNAQPAVASVVSASARSRNIVTETGTIRCTGPFQFCFPKKQGGQ